MAKSRHGLLRTTRYEGSLHMSRRETSSRICSLKELFLEAKVVVTARTKRLDTASVPTERHWSANTRCLSGDLICPSRVWKNLHLQGKREAYLVPGDAHDGSSFHPGILRVHNAASNDELFGTCTLHSMVSRVPNSKYGSSFHFIVFDTSGLTTSSKVLINL